MYLHRSQSRVCSQSCFGICVWRGLLRLVSLRFSAECRSRIDKINTQRLAKFWIEAFIETFYRLIKLILAKNTQCAKDSSVGRRFAMFAFKLVIGDLRSEADRVTRSWVCPILAIRWIVPREPQTEGALLNMVKFWTTVRFLDLLLAESETPVSSIRETTNLEIEHSGLKGDRLNDLGEYSKS